MSAINFNQFFQNIESGVESLGQSSLQDYIAQAKKDGQNVISGMKSNLQQWALEVEEGALTLEDLNFLLKAEESLSEMTALKEAGLAAVRVDAFKSGITNVITGAIASIIKV